MCNPLDGEESRLCSFPAFVSVLSTLLQTGRSASYCWRPFHISICLLPTSSCSYKCSSLLLEKLQEGLPNLPSPSLPHHHPPTHQEHRKHPRHYTIYHPSPPLTLPSNISSKPNRSPACLLSPHEPPQYQNPTTHATNPPLYSQSGIRHYDVMTLVPDHALSGQPRLPALKAWPLSYPVLQGQLVGGTLPNLSNIEYLALKSGCNSVAVPYRI